MSEKALVLRNCRSDMTSYGCFKWPVSGFVEAPDWNAKPACGAGLHGWLWGQGDSTLGFFKGQSDVKWLVVEVDAASIVNLHDKVKFPSGNVVYCGTVEGATQYIVDHGGDRAKVQHYVRVLDTDEPGASAAEFGVVVARTDQKDVVADCQSKVIANSSNKIKVGNYSTVSCVHNNEIRCNTGGVVSCNDDNTVVVGSDSVVVSGHHNKINSSHAGTVVAGYKAVINGGYRTKVFAGECSVVRGGDYSILVGSHKSVLTGGEGSVLVGDTSSIFCGGLNSVFIMKDSISDTRYVAIVGEDGIRPNVKYRVLHGGFWESMQDV